MALAAVGSSDLLAEKVFRILHGAIMSGDLPAGTQLKVRDLAEQVGTSVMPVREAIRRLEESGLAVREGYKGAVVRGLRMDEVRQAYEVRLLLEVEAARLGGAAMTTAGCTDLRRLRVQMTRAVDDGDVLSALDLDEAILARIYLEAGNPMLLEYVRALWARCRAYKLRGARRWLQESDDAMWAHQVPLVEAVESRDGEAAAEIVRVSLVAATARIGETFDGPTTA